ncbi:MAG: holo-ACP synthase [Bacteroidota bacterium]|nr:holo-ACP synthase [Bacteroidota bacterium]
MIIGIGSDIVEHKTNTLLLEWDVEGKLPNRILSDAELVTYTQTKKHTFLAGRFAAKEAILKALGTGMQDGISLKNIDIRSSDKGQPVIELTGAVKELAAERGINKWHLTITHSESYSIAFAIAET